jgi:hypothetical protein
LAKELSTSSENALWAAVRALEEKAAMHRRISDGLQGTGQTSARLLEQADADTQNARLIRNMIFQDSDEFADDATREEGVWHREAS